MVLKAVDPDVVVKAAPWVGLSSGIFSRKDATCTCDRKAIPSLHFRSTKFRKACAGLYQGFLGAVLYPFLKGIVSRYHGPLACDYLSDYPLLRSLSIFEVQVC